jgi:hypothetical protein
VSTRPGRAPTPEEIEALTAFLPRLYAEGFQPVTNWSAFEKGSDGAYRLPYPSYDPLVAEFFGTLGGEGWIDRSYDPTSSWRMLQDEARVGAATLSEIRSMLTFCVRGERFSDGHWAEMIEKGYVRRLLERLREVAAQTPG